MEGRFRAQAVGLRRQDCYLPAPGWGRLTLEKSRPKVNGRWTDTGSAHDERGLKHRAAEETRRVPRSGQRLPFRCDLLGLERGWRRCTADWVPPGWVSRKIFSDSSRVAR